MRARLARVFLVVALLAGWQAALQHPIAHVDELGAFVHLHSGHSHEGGSEAAPLCDLLAALAACASAPMQALVAIVPLDRPVLRLVESNPRAAQAPPFLSQGPPRSA